jgi:hypothetical protein
MNRLGLTLATTSLLLLAAGATDAQTPVLERGARMRVWTPLIVTESGERLPVAGPVEGWFARRTADSLWFRRDPVDETVVAVGLGTVERVQVSLGKRRNTLKGAAWGGGIGLGLGVLAATSLPDCGPGFEDWLWWCEGDEAVVILGTTLGVAAWGALIGTFIKSERWGEVPPATLSLLSERGRVGLALRVRLRL